MKPIRWLSIPVICTVILAGCETVPVAPTLPPVSTDIAEKAERDGEYLLAAREYTRLAELSEPPQKQDYELRTVAVLLKAGQLREARSRIELINVIPLDSSFAARKRILQARVLITEGAHEKGIRQLDEASRLRNLSPALLSEINSVRAQSELALDNPIGAVRNLIAREQYIVNQESITENQQQLWKILVSMPRARLATEFNMARDPVLSGWVELALIAVENAGKPTRLNAAVEQWKKTHPGHPAGVTVLGALISQAPGMIGRVDRIALLLPLTSGYAIAAQAVRDGFLAMDAANADPDKPVIKIYDTGPDPTKAPDIYELAVNDGAQFIVGPLGREASETILRRASIRAPTLMLNQTDDEPGSTSKYLFQFGLPPEQEARQVAERAYLDGHRQAAVLYPKTPWGERMMTAWSKHWQRLGGIVIASQPYGEEDVDFSEPIKNLLNINQSEARREMIEKTIKQKIRFDARARQDIDFIFLAADAKRGRLIKPQLNFYHAARVPVYSTSHIFTGTGDAIRDIDLDGIQFGDMPWMLVGDGKILELRQTLQRDWPYVHSDLDRLYALGVDSYAVIPHLNRIGMDTGARFSGVTSGLSVDHSGRLQRQLLWARFSRGVPRLVDTFLKHQDQFKIQELNETNGHKPRE
ncbi:MAG: penicillin-binding protein activator [Gammaproteobacteria bacterium]|nr:penicillin-binding protein activator [Gammaproteobacteria bacterium]MDH3406266.1 penicillin-binding protein activator [Gammaproteobacteria bacterium]MDH3562454.1 penicillin-binding protein activator [Gammaproteobacteria bacterium]